jgi:hypothetical protein
MGTNELVLQKAQAGIESTRGTGVAATRKIYAQVTPSYDRPLMDFSDQTGTYFDRRRVAYGREKVSFSAVDIATYEDLPWWLGLGLKGGVSGSSDGHSTAPAVTYTFAPAADADDLKSITLEYGEPGNVYESTQVMAQSWTLRGDADNDNEPGWMLDLSLIGRDRTTSSYTGSISDRTTEVILARGTKLFIDDAGGTIGTTQISGKLINFSITCELGLHLKAFMEDESTYAANKVGRSALRVNGQFQFEFDSDTEFAKYRAATPAQRLIRLEREGSQVHAIQASPSLPATNRKATIDLWGYWNSFSHGDREGNMTATFGFAGFYDATAGKVIEVKVVNALTTLP